MASITITTDLAAPPERLWPLLIDFGRHHEWMTGHDRVVTTPPAEPVQGAAFTQYGTLRGVSGRVDWLIEELTPPGLLHLTGRAPRGLRVAARVALSPSAGGTTLTCRYELHGTRFATPLLRAAHRTAHRNTRASLTRLDALARRPAALNRPA